MKSRPGLRRAARLPIPENRREARTTARRHDPDQPPTSERSHNTEGPPCGQPFAMVFRLSRVQRQMVLLTTTAPLPALWHGTNIKRKNRAALAPVNSVVWQSAGITESRGRRRLAS